MSNETKIRLNNDKVAQLSGDTLTLYGITNYFDANNLLIEGSPITNLLSSTNIAPNQSISGETTLTLDLNENTYYPEILLNGNINSLIINNGIQSKTYTIKFIQGATGGILTLAPNWTGATPYIIGTRVIFVSSGYYHVYRCTTGHTSHATDYTLDLANWTLNYRVESGNQIILSTQETQVDFLEIFVEGTNLYRITPIYA